MPVAGTCRAADWQPVRTLKGPGFRVAVEDTDPFRDCYHRQIATRLTEAEFARWQRDFRAGLAGDRAERGGLRLGAGGRTRRCSCHWRLSMTAAM